MTRPSPSKANLEYPAALATLDVAALKADLKIMMKTSQDFWPADYGHYGPMLIRLAWHCAGTYRRSDGIGGCEGGRIRFDHERSWADNTNLDKATRLLWPIKKKYGSAISWGDLIVLTGDTAMEDMGFQTLGTCLGRIDEDSGFWSEELGPSDKQQEVTPCEEGSGICQEPFGAAFLSHIYVNPGGKSGNSSDLVGSALQIREVFGRMAMNDSETVALIGGGHAFGKVHGRCPGGAGPSPMEQPWNPWPGSCEGGKGFGATTSGFEGPWTETPTRWSKKYFEYLDQLEFKKSTSPAGNTQWNMKDPADQKFAPPAHPEAAGSNGMVPTMMLTSDLALLHDPQLREIVKTFATDFGALNASFASAWYKLMTRDMGPYARCLGPLKPPLQHWQEDVPTTTPSESAITEATTLIKAWLSTPTAVNSAIWLAAQCAGTHRVTDYRGGCNGARIRFAPEKDYPVNMKGAVNMLDAPLAELTSIKASLSSPVSMADLIVLAGNLAVGTVGIEVPFCAGRGDAMDGTGSAHLYPWLTMNALNKALFTQTDLSFFQHGIKISGLTNYEAVAFMARMHLTDWRSYYTELLGSSWEATSSTDAADAYRAVGGFETRSQADLFLTYDDDLKAIAQEFAVGTSEFFISTFASAWNKMMGSDRFDGPISNVCTPLFETKKTFELGTCRDVKQVFSENACCGANLDKAL